MTDKLAAALQLAERGFRVFPLAINGKVPAIDGNWRVVATSDAEKVRNLWTCPIFDSVMDYNIGIAVDERTVVLDVDVRDGKQGAKNLAAWEAINGELPATYEVRTASGGRHLYFECDDSRGFPKELVRHVDIKGHGGFVVGPGSEIDGKRYVVRSGTASVGALPENAACLAGKAPRERVATTASPAVVLVDPDAPTAIARAREWLERHAPDHGTYAVAARVKDFGVSEQAALDLLMDHWPPAAAKGEEHVAFRVANAYRYGQNAVGVASAEAEFEAVEIDRKPAPKRRGLYYVRWRDASADVEQPYLIDDVMDLGGMVVTYGDSNTGKSYVVLDQAFHIATGRAWNGHKVRGGLVAYVAAEGGRGFMKRIDAFRRHYGAPDVPFALIPCPVDLHSAEGDTGRLIRLIRDAEADFGQKCVLIVLDTLARVMVGGDESAAVDMGKFVGHSDRLRAATGATVNIIHHTGKDTSKGARGSSALRAATDTEIEVGGNAVTVRKQRDLAPIDPARFALRSVEVGQRSDGKTITACVVEWIAESEFDRKVSPLAKQFLGILDRLIVERMEAIGGEEEPDKADIAVTWSDWEKAGKTSLKGVRGKSINRTALFGLRLELSESGLIERVGKYQWVTVDCPNCPISPSTPVSAQSN